MKIPLVWLKDYVNTDRSAKELAASFTQLGLMLDKPLGKDNVLDLEHRMDRADWLSIIGCARDLAAFENIKLKLPKLYTKPGKALNLQGKIQIKIQTPAVRRFQTRVFKNIKVGPSPKWLVERLSLYGMDSINNIVDITNFVMVEYGQPMHAQDIAKLKGRDITIRKAKTNEKITTLLGTEVVLSQDINLLTSGGEPIVILGVVGGKQTGVTSQTKDIILDSGNYDSRVIRKSSRKLKIINETVSRDDKFLDPRLIDFAMARATGLILELAGGTYYDNDDYYPNPIKPKTQTLRLSRLLLLSGMNLTLSVAKKILKSLDYVVVEEGSDILTLEIPYFRTDVEVEDDLIADILRIYNYNEIPAHALSTPVPLDLTPPIYRFEETLRDLMVAQGAHEHITSSLISASNHSGEVKLVNALSADQNGLRSDLSIGLTHVVSTYLKHKLTNIVVFEIGKVFTHQKEKYIETRHLTAMGGSDLHSNLATLLRSLGIPNYRISQDLHILINGEIIGSLTDRSFTLLTQMLSKFAKNYTGIVSEFTHEMSLDLSLLAMSSVTYADIIKVIDELKGAWLGVTCKSMTKLGDAHNYLLTITWAGNSQAVTTDKDKILKALKEKLKLTSKS